MRKRRDPLGIVATVRAAIAAVDPLLPAGGRGGTVRAKRARADDPMGAFGVLAWCWPLLACTA